MLGFLAPLFLAGLAAIAIPLLVHLTHKESKEPVAFPSLMFLMRIPFKTTRRQRIRHWLLFALRTAAVALIVFAFARPFFRRQVASVAGGGDVVLLLDRSASMQARGRWDRALVASREAVTRLGAGGRMAVVAFDERAEALTDLAADRAQLNNALATVRPGSGAGRYAAGLQAAAAILDRAGNGGEVVLVSDFQRVGWDGSAAARLPGGVALRTMDVGDTSLVNTALVGVVLERESGGEPRTIVTARLAAVRGQPRDVPVTLEVDGRTVQTVTVKVAAGGAGLARFAALRDPQTARRARVSVAADAQPADDAWYFVLGPAPRLPIALAVRGDAPPRDAVYLRQALAVASDPAFPVAQRAGAALRPAELAGTAVVLLHDVPFPSGDAGGRLLEWVRNGGGLMIALGARGTLPRDLADSLGTGGNVVDRGDAGAGLAISDAAHPVFAGWAGPSGTGTSRTFRYRRLERAGTALARFDDGAPALVEARHGRGRVIVWTADFANRWSDVALQPAFVPIVHSALRYLAGFTPPPASREVGSVVELDAAPTLTTVVLRPGGGSLSFPSGTPARLILAERGFYQVRKAGGTATETMLAVNVPPAEADPARLVPEQLVAAVTSTEGGVRAAGSGVAEASERERGQKLWWYLLAGVLLLVAAETAVAHRIPGYR